MDCKWSHKRLAVRLIAALGVPFVLACAPMAANAAATLPKPKHVFIIVLENEGYDVTFGPKSPALYLNALARKGALLTKYHGIGHFSLDNYIAMISGQAPNPVTQSDCQIDNYKFADFLPKDKDGNGTIDENGQALGRGCVYPKNVPTLANQLEAKGLSWKGYMEDMGNDPARDGGTACAHPPVDGTDKAQKAVKGDQYATRHNPFMYFHSIIDDQPNCEKHVVNLSSLVKDLEKLETTPNYVFITPNLCRDGHDEPCVDNEPGGLISADRFLMQYVPMILNSQAFGYDQSDKYNGGLLIITFDESETEDASRCCNEPHGPNIKKGDTVFGTIPDKGPGVYGPGGGRIGAVLVSRYIKEDTVSKVPYNHYSMLRSIEDFFGLDHLGYAAQKRLKSFGEDVFTKPGGERF